MPLLTPLPTAKEILQAHRELTDALNELSSAPPPLLTLIKNDPNVRGVALQAFERGFATTKGNALGLIGWGMEIVLRVAGNRQAALMKDQAAAQQLFPCDGCGDEFPPSLLTALEGEIRLCANCLRESGR